jgi:hypothetical protein
MLVRPLVIGFLASGIQKIIDHWHEPLRTGHQCHVIGVGQEEFRLLPRARLAIPSWPPPSRDILSPSLLVLLHQVHTQSLVAVR